jgi:hypothetical protein
MADEAAKEAALHMEVIIVNLTLVLPPLPTSPRFSVVVEKRLNKLGAIKDRERKWKLPDGREMITKPIMTEIMTLFIRGVTGDHNPCVTLS